MVIVYQSHTGFTKEYAQMLGKAEKMKTYTLEEAERQLLSDAQVFYMGPLTAGHIGGLDRSMKRWKIQAVCGVGMSQPGEGTMASLRRSNYVGDAPLFYLQGGYAPEKLGFFYRMMMKPMAGSVVRQVQARGEAATDQERRMAEIFQHGGDFVREEALDEIVRWFREGPHDGEVKAVPSVDI